ncbi:MAG: GNAT family N-acetyltransferase [Bacilli bacterium]|jgi:ribosomal protein S18 acetylase RimI-like enzyme
MEKKYITMRYAKAYDIDTLASLHVRTFRSAYQGILPDSYLEKITFKSRKAAFSKLILELHIPQAIFFYKDEAIGFAVFGPCRDEDLPGYGQIQGIYIVPEYQRLGFGSLFFQWCLRELKKQGFTKICIWVFATNHRAIAFYQSQKFEFDGVAKEVFYDEPLQQKRLLRTLPWLGT